VEAAVRIRRQPYLMCDASRCASVTCMCRGRARTEVVAHVHGSRTCANAYACVYLHVSVRARASVFWAGRGRMVRQLNTAGGVGVTHGHI